MHPIYSACVLAIVAATITDTAASPYHYWNCENLQIAPRFCVPYFQHPQEYYSPYQYPHFIPKFPHPGSPYLPTPFQFQRNPIQPPLQFQPQQGQWPTSQNSAVPSWNEDLQRRPQQPGWPQEPAKLPAQVVNSGNGRVQAKPAGPAEAVGISQSQSYSDARCDSSSRWSPRLGKCVSRGK